MVRHLLMPVVSALFALPTAYLMINCTHRTLVECQILICQVYARMLWTVAVLRKLLWYRRNVPVENESIEVPRIEEHPFG